MHLKCPAQLNLSLSVDRPQSKRSAILGGKAEKTGFVSPVADFYQTNPIARASAVMAECSALASGRLQQAAE